MPKMSKKEQEEEISKFLKFIDFELENWGIYKDSPEMQKIEKDKIIIGILQLSEAIQTAIIPKLIEAGIFTANEINEAFKIPIEKRNLINIKDLMESDIKPDKMLVGGGLIPEIIGFALIGGLAKEGKTLLSLQLGLNLISGTNFLEDFKVNRKCKILYIYRENTKSD